MQTLESRDLVSVSGGTAASNSAANAELGATIGKVAHAMNSTESRMGGVFGIGGAIIGAIIHQKLRH